MGRPLRVAPSGLVYHVLNRANGRMTLFDDDGDYAAFARVGRRPVNGCRCDCWRTVLCPITGISSSGRDGTAISPGS